VWDPFSGEDTFTATFETEEQADDDHVTSNLQLTNDSRSSRSPSLDEQPEEPLEPLSAFYHTRRITDGATRRQTRHHTAASEPQATRHWSRSVAR